MLNANKLVLYAIYTLSKTTNVFNIININKHNSTIITITALQHQLILECVCSDKKEN